MRIRAFWRHRPGVLEAWPAALALSLHCSPRPPSSASDWPSAGELLSPAAQPGNFLDRQKIIATYRDKTSSFDAVLQKRGGELTLLGLTPFGSRAFVLRQRGTDVSFESFVPQTLPFPPRYVLIDVERVFFWWIDVGDAAAYSGERQAERDGEVVTEQWTAGRMFRRTFRRIDQRPPGEIVVNYEGGMSADGTPPSRVSFENGWYGYRLAIETLSHQQL